MFKWFTVVGLVGAAWTTSQYMTTSSGQFGATPSATMTLTQTEAPSPGSVALLDFAVAALPQSRTATPEPAAEMLSAVEDASATEPRSAVVLPVIEPQEADSDPALVRRLQAGLRRVGCLKTRADGVWGPASQRAMQRFADRIDATLPTDRPDAVLLMLVEKYDDRACGKPCASDQTLDDRGRCIARQEVAEAVDEPATVASLPEAASPATPAPVIVAASVPAPFVTGGSLNSMAPKTKIGRVTHAKLPRIARAKSRKTNWSAPVYGLGMAQVKAPSASVRKRKRVGASAAYRRWMSRSGVAMR